MSVSLAETLMEMAEKMAKKWYGTVHFGRVHVHLPLHLLFASETMVPRHRCIATTANSRE